MGRKLNFTIGQKILGSFILMVILFLINAAVIGRTSSRIDQTVSHSSDVIQPSVEKLNELVFLIGRSKMLITNWVYLPTNVGDKAKLKQILNLDYPKLKEEVKTLATNWKMDSLRSNLTEVIDRTDQVMRTQGDEIMKALITFDDYQDPMIRFTVEDKLESEVIPEMEAISNSLMDLVDEYRVIRSESERKIATDMEELSTITITLTTINVLIAIVFAFLLIKAIRRPVEKLKDVIVNLSNGEVDEKSDIPQGRDEIGQIGEALIRLQNGLKETSAFAHQIGNGNYNSQFSPLGKKDKLGNSLIEMKTNLMRVAEEDRRRAWANEGIARFAELLRSNNDDLETLSDELLSSLIKYMDVNQGALYLKESDDNKTEQYLVLASCYAWDKHKQMDQKFYPGDGLAGQVWQEGAPVYMTDIPDGYIQITSGLGDSNPTSLFICPLIMNEEVYGVIEIASFDEIAEYKREFLVKLGESIASTVHNVRNAARTKHLLEESQMMTEQMKAQEEEMRQNMEEIQATQEEMERTQFETANTMNAIDESVLHVVLDNEGKLDYANQKFLSSVNYQEKDVEGETFRMFYASDKGEKFKMILRELQAAQNVSGDYEWVARDGSMVTVRGTFSPVRDRGEEISRILFYGLDITALVNSEKAVGV